MSDFDELKLGEALRYSFTAPASVQERPKLRPMIEEGVIWRVLYVARPAAAADGL